jgi:queuine tRNA-ribosyltransferase subunit QTRTD1
MKSNLLLTKTIDCIYRTRIGTLYNLTDHNQAHCPIKNVEVNLTEFLGREYMLEFLRNDKITYKKYLNFEKYNLYLTTFNPIAQRRNLGSGKDDTIRVHTNGYRDLTINEFLNYAEAMKPDILVSMSEIPETHEAGEKRNKRAFIKNKKFLNQAIKLKDKGLKQVYCPINACVWEEILTESLKLYKGLNPDGYVIQGLHMGESEADRVKIYQYIADTIADEIKEKNVVLSSDGNPISVLQALSFGVNMFEVEYPFALAEKGCAIDFNTSDFDHQNIKEENNSNMIGDYSPKTINLKDKVHKEKMEGLDPKCNCYSCKNHTKAYIHHLLDCDEMTGYVLLTIHNVNAYGKFIRTLNENVEHLGKFKHWFFENHCWKLDI